MPSDARELAGALARQDDASLADLFAARQVSAGAGWRDFFDAAEALLEDASIDRILTRLPAATLRALADAGRSAPDEPHRTELAALALVDAEGRAYPAVARRVAASGAEENAALLTDAAPGPADELAAAAAAERVFAAIGSLGDILFACLHGPLARTGAGAVAAADRRGLIDSGSVADAEELEDLIAAADDAGLLATDGTEWLVTDDGDAWLRSSTAQRWARIVRGFREALPPGLRHDAGMTSPQTWERAYPLDTAWPGRARALRRRAEQWALLTPDGREPVWATAVREGGTPDASTLAALLPQEIDRIYLQADLTAIAPGPLAPALDLRLRGMAARESRAQASTYRFTERTVSAAVADGETAQSLRAFLGELSLTGIPQPLDYLIDRAAARHGLVRVAADGGGARVDAADASLLGAIAVDQALGALGLIEDGDALHTRVSRDAVYWALSDARYPVVAVDDEGRTEPVRRRRLATSGGSAAVSAYAGLIATLRATHDDDAESAWMTRELEAAVRARSQVALVIAFPDGSHREITLEATGLGGGRLRGRDIAGDTERTLPVASIVSVRAAG